MFHLVFDLLQVSVSVMGDVLVTFLIPATNTWQKQLQEGQLSWFTALEYSPSDSGNRN